MKILLIILSLGFVLIECNQKSNQDKRTKNAANPNTESSSTSLNQADSIDIVERYFPENTEANRTDTLIQNLNLKISIIQKPIDSYVIDEFESDGKKHVHKYRNYENHLIVKKGEQILIDTILTKQNLISYTDQKFLDVAIFQGYWFNKSDDKKIELFGVISKPETDWSFAFYHYFDLTTLKFDIKEHIEEEI